MGRLPRPRMSLGSSTICVYFASVADERHKELRRRREGSRRVRSDVPDANAPRRRLPPRVRLTRTQRPRRVRQPWRRRRRRRPGGGGDACGRRRAASPHHALRPRRALDVLRLP